MLRVFQSDTHGIPTHCLTNVMGVIWPPDFAPVTGIEQSTHPIPPQANLESFSTSLVLFWVLGCC